MLFIASLDKLLLSFFNSERANESLTICADIYVGHVSLEINCLLLEWHLAWFINRLSLSGSILIQIAARGWVSERGLRMIFVQSTYTFLFVGFLAVSTALDLTNPWRFRNIFALRFCINACYFSRFFYRLFNIDHIPIFKIVGIVLLINFSTRILLFLRHLTFLIALTLFCSLSLLLSNQILLCHFIT